MDTIKFIARNTTHEDINVRFEITIHTNNNTILSVLGLFHTIDTTEISSNRVGLQGSVHSPLPQTEEEYKYVDSRSNITVLCSIVIGGINHILLIYFAFVEWSYIVVECRTFDREEDPHQCEHDHRPNAD